MTTLEKITDALLHRNKCERLVKQTAQEITVTGVNVGIPNFSFALGGASNKVIKLYDVDKVMVALDNQQYLLCSTIADLNEGELKDKCIRIRLQTILAFSNLQALESLNQDAFKPEITKWVENMNKLCEISEKMLDPNLDVGKTNGASYTPHPIPQAIAGVGGGMEGGGYQIGGSNNQISDVHIHENLVLSQIQSYQGITDNQLENAVIKMKASKKSKFINK